MTTVELFYMVSVNWRGQKLVNALWWAFIAAYIAY